MRTQNYVLCTQLIVTVQGENGQNATKGPFGSVDPAIKDFEKKFKDKTRNAWANRASFSAVPGKYTLIEMDDAGGDDDDDTAEKVKCFAKCNYRR